MNVTKFRKIIETAKKKVEKFHQKNWEACRTPRQVKYAMGVYECMEHLISEIEEDFDTASENYEKCGDILHTLNSCEDWLRYSQGGCFLVQPAQIAQLCCTSNMLKEYEYDAVNGTINQEINGDNIFWFRIQAQMLFEAEKIILGHAVAKNGNFRFAKF